MGADWTLREPRYCCSVLVFHHRTKRYYTLILISSGAEIWGGCISAHMFIEWYGLNYCASSIGTTYYVLERITCLIVTLCIIPSWFLTLKLVISGSQIHILLCWIVCCKSFEYLSIAQEILICFQEKEETDLKTATESVPISWPISL